MTVTNVHVKSGGAGFFPHSPTHYYIKRIEDAAFLPEGEWAECWMAFDVATGTKLADSIYLGWLRERMSDRYPLATEVPQGGR